MKGGRRELPLVAALALAVGCSSPAPPPQSAASPSTEGVGGGGFTSEARLLHFHSKRFNFSLPLPDGKAWRIDDHSSPLLVATHPPTGSRITAAVLPDEALVNRQACEARARTLGLVPNGDLHTLEDEVTVTPTKATGEAPAFDTRLWVAFEVVGDAKTPSPKLVGHVLAFGGYVRKCFFFHFASEVPSVREEPLLSDRLAIARTRVYGGLTFDPFGDVAPRPPIPEPLSPAGGGKGLGVRGPKP